jgi:hypothetical protein
VPGELEGAGRWSLDHLFLDQEGIPTLIEVKRSSDSRIRREVVGQMLDYAANAVVYWPIDQIRATFEARCRADGREPNDELRAFLGDELDSEAFWTAVRDNLQAGMVRLLFVADAIPAELRRIIEFLNEQMVSAEVLGLEIKQFADKRQRTLVPRVVGKTARADQRKERPSGARRKWDEASFFDELDRSASKAAANVARELYSWALRIGATPEFGSGAANGAFLPTFRGDGVPFKPIAVQTNGILKVEFVYLDRHPALESTAARRELMNRLNAIPDVAIPEDAIHRWPTVQLEALAPPKALKTFVSVIEWAAAKTGWVPPRG